MSNGSSKDRFLLDYGGVDAVIAYVVARLRPREKDIWDLSPAGAIAWVTDLVANGGKGGTTGTDPKPPPMPQSAAEEIFQKLTSNEP